MTSFGIWFNGQKTTRRLTYVCGREPVLIEEVVEHLRKEISPLPMNLIRLTGSEDIWNEFSQFSIEDRSSRLFIVRDVKSWSGLEPLLAALRMHSQNYVVFTSDEVRTDAAHFELLKQNTGIAQIVLCNGLSSTAPKDKWGQNTRQPDSVLWIQSRGNISPLNAKYLWERTGGNLLKIRDVMAKASLFSGDITHKVIDALVQESVGDVFVESLLCLDKRKACLAIPNVDPARYPHIIGLLDTALDMMAKLNSHHRLFHDRRTAACDEAIPTFFMARYWDASRRWDSGRRQVARAALAALDGPVRAWQVEGALESLVALF